MGRTRSSSLLWDMRVSICSHYLSNVSLIHSLACFLGALQLVAGKAGKKDAAKNAKIHTAVHLGTPEGFEGFGLSVDIKVEGVEDEELIQAAHEVHIQLDSVERD